MSEAVDIANRDAIRVMKEISQCVNDGYEIWHWWDDPIEEGDKVFTFGFLTLVKKNEKSA
jgi:hypothetical protein